jgi:hypothetical protein
MFNRFIKAYFTLSSRCNLLLLAAAALLTASAVRADDDLASAPYKQASVPIEDRVKDLLGRMTVEEKARQLDFYNGSGKGAQSAPAILILDKCADDTHCAPDSKFLPDQAEKLWGTLGVGAIHDLYPYPDLANTIQDWVIKHNRLGIPALFFEEGVHGSEALARRSIPTSPAPSARPSPPRCARAAFTWYSGRYSISPANRAGAVSRRIWAKTRT